MPRRLPALAAVVAALAATGLSAAPAAAAPAAPAAPVVTDVTTQELEQAGPVARSRPGAAARRYLGAPRSGLPWHSGAWTGGHMSGARLNSFGTWRGSAMDVAMTYPENGSWAQIANSTWHIDTYRGFRGRLMYGLPLLPKHGGSLKAVAAGRHDAVFRKVAQDLRRHGRGNAIVRIGWEANGDWHSWSVNAATAGDFRGAYRRVAKVMKAAAPGLLFDFDINCGSPLPGQSTRRDSLTRLYPGDDVVDLVGCDSYDWGRTKGHDEASWRSSLYPQDSVGLGDVAKFARTRGKGFAVPEWGLATPRAGGNGDNPFYITKMKQFFQANSDVLVVENYFNEPASYISNSLWHEAPQNPKAAQAYRRYW